MKLARGNHFRRLAGIFLAAAIAGGCGGTTPEAGPGHGTVGSLAMGAGGKLRVVATTNILGDIVGQVGGDHIELTVLMDIGIDPHSYVPNPAGMAAVHDADVVFASGAGLEVNLDEMFQTAGGDAVHIYASDGLALRQAGGGREKAVDPHVWFDVQNAIHWVETIEGTLAALDPADAGVYRANAAAFTQQLQELDAWVMEQVATIPEANRRLVTNHPAFAYLERYGLKQVGAVYPVSPSAEPSAQDIAALQDVIRSYSVPAIFTESTVNPKLGQQLANDTGAKLVTLYSGSLGVPGSGAETYIQLIRYDVTAIVQALRGP